MGGIYGIGFALLFHIGYIDSYGIKFLRGNYLLFGLGLEKTGGFYAVRVFPSILCCLKFL